MNTPHQIRRQLATLTTQNTVLTAILPMALDHLELKLRVADGYPSTASGSDVGGGSTGTSEHSSTEQAVLTRLGHNDRDDAAIGAQAVLDEIADYLHAATLGAGHALKLVNNQAVGHAHADRHRLRCRGTEDAQGATCEQWACPRPNPDGTGNTIKDGRCLDCGAYIDRQTAEREAARRAEIEQNRRLRRAGRSAA